MLGHPPAETSRWSERLPQRTPDRDRSARSRSKSGASFLQCSTRLRNSPPGGRTGTNIRSARPVAVASAARMTHALTDNACAPLAGGLELDLGSHRRRSRRAKLRYALNTRRERAQLPRSLRTLRSWFGCTEDLSCARPRTLGGESPGRAFRCAVPGGRLSTRWTWNAGG
jgi:hypothetical protein